MVRRVYKGKYPNRIRAVWGDKGKGLVIQTNDGLKYRIIPLTLIGRSNAPKPGKEIWEYVTTQDYKGEIVS